MQPEEPAAPPTPPEAPPPEAPEPEPAARADAEPERLGTIFFFALLLLSVASLGLLFFGYAADFVLALLFASLGAPAFHRLQARLGGRRALAAALVCLALVVLVALPLVYLVTSLSAEAAHAFEATRSSLSNEKVEAALFGEGRIAVQLRRGAELLGLEYSPAAVKAAVGKVSGTVASAIYKEVNAAVANVLAAAFHFAIVVAMLFYLLLDGPALKRFLRGLSPLPEAQEDLLARKFHDVGYAILLGNGVGSVLQGALGGLAMWLAGLPSALLWGTVMAIAAFLPLVGVSAVAIPASIYLALQDRVVTAVIFAAFTLGQGFLVENVLKTKLIGDHMQMHNLLIFLSLLGGIAAFGLIGLLYGPLLVALFLTLAELYQSDYRRRLLRADDGR
jgi:predicted PurR-regulated permease PerM